MYHGPGPVALAFLLSHPSFLPVFSLISVKSSLGLPHPVDDVVGQSSGLLTCGGLHRGSKGRGKGGGARPGPAEQGLGQLVLIWALDTNPEVRMAENDWPFCQP